MSELFSDVENEIRNRGPGEREKVMEGREERREKGMIEGMAELDLNLGSLPPG